MHRGYTGRIAKDEVGPGWGSPWTLCIASIMEEQLKLKQAFKQGCPWALYTKGALGGLLKLKWMQADVSYSA